MSSRHCCGPGRCPPPLRLFNHAAMMLVLCPDVRDIFIIVDSDQKDIPFMLRMP